MELSCIAFEIWGYMVAIDFSRSLFFILSLLYSWDILIIFYFSSFGFMLSTSLWTKFTNSSSSFNACLLKIEFSFWRSLTRDLKSHISDAACLNDSDLSSNYLKILTIISLFWLTCFTRESLDVIFNSCISFYVAVYSPLCWRDWALELVFEALSTLVSSLSAS